MLKFVLIAGVQGHLTWVHACRHQVHHPPDLQGETALRVGDTHPEELAACQCEARLPAILTFSFAGQTSVIRKA